MTGFGRADGAWRGASLTVETRSLNHRFLEIRVRLPRDMSYLEQAVTEFVRSKVVRGRVDVFISISGVPEGVGSPVLNLPLVRKYIEFIETLRSEMKGWAAPDPLLLLTMRDVIMWEEGAKDSESEWAEMKPIVERALDEMITAGYVEGARLEQDLRERIGRLEELVQKMKSVQPAELSAYKAKLEERLEELMGKSNLEPERLAQELAYWAEKCDCTEEMVRLKAHRERFIEVLEKGGAMGRTLDFLVQEMMREVNTVSSKALSAEVSHFAVEAKSELEKIREQVQNIE